MLFISQKTKPVAIRNIPEPNKTKKTDWPSFSQTIYRVTN